MRYAIAALALLAGCAGPQQQRPVQASEAPNSMLCEYMLRGTPQEQAAAGYEARRRSLDCAAMYRAETARREQQNANMEQARRMLTPPPPPIPQPRQCTSQWHGSQLVTVCD
jgi:hypothetical protein